MTTLQQFIATEREAARKAEPVPGAYAELLLERLQALVDEELEFHCPHCNKACNTWFDRCLDEHGNMATRCEHCGGDVDREPESTRSNPGIDAIKADEQQKQDNEVVQMRELMADLYAWHDAYPDTIFKEPDFAKAHKVLTENGMTLDALSASILRIFTADLRRRIDAVRSTALRCSSAHNLNQG